MSSVTPLWQRSEVWATERDVQQWYAIQTRARHEKNVANQLQYQGITTFLPIVRETHRWSDRCKVVELPLFSCYVFVYLPWSAEPRVKVLRTDGVFGFVGTRGEGIPIPDAEIESIRTLLVSKVPYTAYPFLTLGQRVRVRGGSLDGIEGILVARKGNSTLVISVEPIQRSLAIQIDRYSVEPI